MEQPDKTADYRKYPKGPNFNLIVILFVLTIFLAFFVAYFVLHRDAKKLLPKVLEDNHPTSQTIPLPPTSPGRLSSFTLA